MPSLILHRHPSTTCGAVHRIEAQARLGQDGLSLRYTLEGDIDAIRIPPPGIAHRADGLWQDTCFEAFLRGADPLAGYYEFNFAPSAAWACYRFTAYREGMAIVETIFPPTITLLREARRIQLDASIRPDGLPPLTAGTDLRLALSAVVKEKDGGVSYWAVTHPPGKPDFHHPDSFALTIGQAGKT